MRGRKEWRIRGERKRGQRTQVKEELLKEARANRIKSIHEGRNQENRERINVQRCYR